MRSPAAVVGLLVVMLVSVPAALAQTPGGDAYGGQGDVQGVVGQGGVQPGGPGGVQPGGGQPGGVQGEVREDVAEQGDLQPIPAGENEPRQAPAPGGGISPTEAERTAPDAGAGGSLPFTGFDVLLLVAGGLALIGTGVAVRRFTPTVPE